jgi:hypothetical protein
MIQSNGFNCRLALLWQLLLLSETAFLFSSFHHDLFFMYTWHYTLAEIRYCLFMMCHDLQPSMILSGRELAHHQLSHWAETRILILSLWALLIEIRSHNLFYDMGFWRPQPTSESKCSLVCIRRVENISLFEEVWYTSERELPVICTIAEQKLTFEVHSLKLQLHYAAWRTEAILASGKCKVRTHILVKIQLSVVTYCPGQCIYGKHVVETFPQTIDWHVALQKWHLSGGLHILIKHRIRYSAGVEQDEPRQHQTV